MKKIYENPSVMMTQLTSRTIVLTGSNVVVDPNNPVPGGEGGD